MMKRTLLAMGAFLLALVLPFSLVTAVANFQLTSFTCSPSEVVLNSAFSCSATIQNSGDASGTVNTATLYPDSSNWLESSSYPQSYGQSVSAGNSFTVTFSGLRSTKTGVNGFSRIMLDSVTDTYVADNNEEVNSISVAVSVSNAASSAAMGGTVVSTSDITAGGEIDVSLTFTSTSGGCSIGSQTNPKSITGMTDGSSQSRTFTITQGTTGNCVYSISAAATGSGGVASDTDSVSSTITCTNCPTSSSSSSSGGGSSGGAGSGGGGIAKTYLVGALTSSRLLELLAGERAQFIVGGENHTLTLKSNTNSSAVIEVESEKQTLTLALLEEKQLDITADGISDISITLQSINPSTNKVGILLAPLVGGGSAAGGSNGEDDGGDGVKLAPFLPELSRTGLYVLLGVVGVIVLVSGVVFFVSWKRRKQRWGVR
ncbi:MAG TPA: hypothetical protein VJK51_03795 [Candidatus Nanoarchaeia archaeon]|nr:hypothetical protein [Candidatus Nanoarchaeia archaeon]